MKNKPSFIYSSFLILIFFYGCVQVRLRTANENYDQFAYAPAAKDYEYVLQRKLEPAAIVNIADCYRMMGNSVKTEFWYRKAVKFPDAKPEWNLYFAEALLKNGKVEEAKEALISYIEVNRNDFHAQRMLNACNDYKQFNKDTTLFSITPLRFNTPGENYFSPSFYRSGIVFLSDKYFKGLSRTQSDGTGLRYLDLFYAKKTDHGNWLDPEPIRGDVNGRFNEGPAAFSADFNTMYFTRNNYISNVVEKNKKNINVLKIYKAEATEGQWKINAEMDFNSGEYSAGHPTLNHDGSIIFFTSDMPWGYGGTDIYYVKSEGDNKWSQPINIGATVNTDGNEMFPFLQNDSTLYFASDGLEGMGGLDIYETHLNNGVWSSPFNLGIPVNSSMDDFSFIIDSIGQNGYFSSNRNGNNDKIFSFVKNPPKLTVEIQVSDLQSKVFLDKASVTIHQSTGRDTTVTTGTSGIIRFRASNDREYSFSVDHFDYYFATASVSTYGKRFSETVNVVIPLTKIPLNKPFVWEGTSFKKKDWQLKLTSGKSLEQLVKFLSDNPRLQIEIGAYTDSRGTEEDNLILTQRRAELVLQYLTSQGIKANRMSAKGYGETKLLNKCVNGILCIEEEHETNNRIEISIKSISKDTAQR